jgi:hypothetical protein
MGNVVGSVPNKSVLSRREVILSHQPTFEQYIEYLGKKQTSGLLEIPEEVLAVPNVIEKMDVSFNNIRTLPEDISFRLPHLSHLDVSYNALTTLPDAFHYLYHLKTLLMTNNRFSSLPLCVCRLRELVKLDVSGNQLQKLPPEFTGLRCLQYLNVGNNMLLEFTLSAEQVRHMKIVMATYNRCKKPPQEVCNQGSRAILEYFQRKYGELPSSETVSNTKPVHKMNEFPRVRGSISQDIIDARKSPSGKPTSRQLQRAPLQEARHDSKLDGKILADKVCGLIYGAAIGDAIGLCTEFLGEDECHFHYDYRGLSYQTMIKDRHRCKWRPGDWTDDTDQMIIILDSLLLWGGVIDEIDFADRLSQWARSGFSELGDSVGWGIGRTVGKCIDHKDFLKNPHDVAHQVWQSTGSAANGAVMRTAILGIPQFNNLADVTENAVRICKATHYDPRCQASCVAICMIVALILQVLIECIHVSTCLSIACSFSLSFLSSLVLQWQVLATFLNSVVGY